MMRPFLVALFCSYAVAQTTVLGVFREDCIDKFTSFDLDMECVKFTVMKALGYGIILGAVFLKVPQIQKLLSSGRADGLPAISCYAEFINWQCTLGNSLRLAMPFSVYGEGIFINLQNVIIIWLVWQYNRSIGVIQKIVFVVFALVLSYVLLDASMLTEYHWDFIASI